MLQSIALRFNGICGPLVALALVAAPAALAQNRDDAESAWRRAAEAGQALRVERARRDLLERRLRRLSDIAHARMPNTLYASTSSPADADVSCPVPVETRSRLPRERRETPLRQDVRRVFDRRAGAARTVPSSRAATAGALPSAGSPLRPSAGRGAHALPAIFAAVGERRRRSVPLFSRASDPLRQGLVRVVNRSSEAGEVVVWAIDDGGRRFGPATLFVDAGATAQFDSDDLENGDLGKGLVGVGAPSEGDWRLELESSLDFEARAYLRHRDGFLAAMHDVAPEVGGAHRVPIFNGGGEDASSLLRLVNVGEADVEAAVRGVDDLGRSPGGEVRVAVPAGASRTLSAAQLESGAGPGVVGGALGDGAGRWRLTVTADGPIRAMSLLESRSGAMANLSTAPPPAEGGVHRVPLFPSASDPFRRGVVRVVNRSGEAGEVSIAPVDDSGRAYEPATLAIGAGEAIHFDSHDLEQGDRAKGLFGGVGAGVGDWRLALRSDLDIEVLAYVRAADGLLTSMHDLVPTVAGERVVAMFDPDREGSALRLVNDGDAPARVSIAGVDDVGAAGRSAVSATVPAGRSLNLSAAQLESGEGEGVVGALGDGAGAWRLAVASDRPLAAMSLLRGPAGRLANLSTVASASGETAASFYEARVSPVVQAKCANCHVEGGASGGTWLVFVRSTNADHLALNQRAFADFLAEADDGAELILNKIQGVSHGGGVQAAAGTDDYASVERYLELLAAESSAATAADVFAARVSPVVQAKCANCHVEGGASGNTRLVFVRSTNADHLALNRQAFADFVADVEGGAELILNKIQGVSHGGGAQAAAGTEDYAAIESFLQLLGAESAAAAATPATLFDGVAMAPAWKTLWRAAIVFAGRLPTAAEYERAESGPAGLRAAIRGLMAGDGFHDFLIRAANDRLLTDKHMGGSTIDGRADFGFVNLTNAGRALLVAGDEAAYWRWDEMNQFGFARAPLELIAHVAQNDLPYTEILTADYVMANPLADAAYGGGATFDDADDVLEFKPSKIVDYYRDDESVVTEYTEAFGLRVVAPGNLRTDWPHAGILNTVVFLKRYPTTPTNRNRARSRWTYYHFLGLDVEKSASRTTDPEALADTDNPTMRNPACTVCHGVLDPVAGAFQNYGVEGFYRDQWGGLDSLDDFYKIEGPSGGEQVEIDGRSEDDKQTFSLTGRLAAGRNEIGLENINIGEGDTNILVDSLTVRDGTGEVVGHWELEDMADWDERDCGNRWGDLGVDVYCRVVVSVQVPREDDYTVEVAAWTGWQSEEAEGRSGALRIWVPMPEDYYREGDTWYRDMRTPGFDGAEVPDADNSLRWLARRIVADEHFAEAAVKFWWPAVLGAELAAPPEDESDADFAGLLLASNAQSAETDRLAHGFRRGFGGGSPFNLKDLLVEIVLSRWARAESTADEDPVRLAAMRDAGMERLLTPEELTSKTAAATGVEFGRDLPDRHTGFTGPSHLRDDGVRLLYGGIDSDGVTERTGDMTATMAGVAQNHAARLAGAIVLRELHLLPAGQRRLFRHVELATTPASEFGETFEIEAASWGDRETVSTRGRLTAGDVVVRLSYTNDYWEEGLPDYNLRLDRLELRNAAGRVVATHELEDLDGVDCTDKGRREGHEDPDHHIFDCDGTLEVPLVVPVDGRYSVDVVAWAEQPEGRLAKLQVLVESDAERSAGAAAIRRQFADLHRDLLGVAAGPDSADVDEAFRLFVDVWRRKRESGEEGDICWPAQCRWYEDLRFFEGIDGAPSPVWVEGENGYDSWEWGHDAVWEWLDDKRADPNHASGTWAVVLAYLMTDHRYLYL